MSAREVYRFAKGQVVWLDEICKIQGLAGGDWWERKDPKNDLDEIIVISCDIEITISSRRGSPLKPAPAAEG